MEEACARQEGGNPAYIIRDAYEQFLALRASASHQSRALGYGFLLHVHALCAGQCIPSDDRTAHVDLRAR